jgi:hypothetical protein
MIHLSDVLEIVNAGDEISIRYIAHGNNNRKRKGGYIVIADNVIITSSNYERNSLNIMFKRSNQIRECKIILIIELNGEETFI